MAACLPEQFCASRVGPSPRRIHSSRTAGSYGRSGTLRRSSSVSPAERQDAPGPGQVPLLAGVAGRGQGEQLAVQRQPGAQQADRLERLERRARVERGLDVAGLERHAAVGGQHDDRAVVDALDDAPAHHMGDGDVGGFAERGRFAGVRCGGTVVL